MSVLELWYEYLVSLATCSVVDGMRRSASEDAVINATVKRKCVEKERGRAPEPVEG